MSLAGKSNTAGGPRGTVHGYVYICTSEEEEAPMRSLEEERKERELLVLGRNFERGILKFLT